MNLGTLLRRYRKERGLTLKAVAERAGVSEGFMSQVENNVKSPSVETLFNICDAIEVDVGELRNELKHQERLFLIRKGEWGDADMPHTGFETRRFCPPEERTVLDSALLFLSADRAIPVRKNIKNGQEILCVLKGALELEHGDRTIRMNEGDAVHIWSDLENQTITNIGGGLAIVMWVGTL
ncbi:MAG: XRE family transcriptional regulator [Proteobacteria bacterium]|nr:XRE family transcriptional regulator [Pseudomonadota bacterium]